MSLPPHPATTPHAASPPARDFAALFGVPGEGTARALARLVGVFALGAVAGVAARFIRMPLPFVLGPLIVMAAPFLVIHFANDGQLREIAQVAVMSWPSLALLAACAAVGGFMISRTPYPNAWFMGPLAACALAGIGGLIEGRVPDILVN